MAFFLEHRCKIDFIDLLSNRMSPITRRTKLSPTFAATLANAEAKSNAVAAKDREKEKAAIEARNKMNEGWVREDREGVISRIDE